MSNNNVTYVYVEDNGGCLHLLVFQDGIAIDGITNLEYAKAGEGIEALQMFSENGVLLEISSWEGHMREIGVIPDQYWKRIQNDEWGYSIVCENGQLHEERMGISAKIYFGVASLDDIEKLFIEADENNTKGTDNGC